MIADTHFVNPMRLLLHWFVVTLAVLLSAYLLPGVSIAGFWAAMVVALVLGLLNAFVRPLLVLLTLPLTIITFGLFLFVINALIILFAAALVPGFHVENFWWALLFSIVLAVVGALLHAALPEA